MVQTYDLLQHPLKISNTSFLHQKTIFSTQVFVTERAYAEKLKRNFDDRAEIIYRGSLSLLSGDVNFIFEDWS